MLEYEIIKYNGDIGVPNLFAHLEERLKKKLSSLRTASNPKGKKIGSERMHYYPY